MVNIWQEAEGVRFPLSPETDWLLTVQGEDRALALHMELSASDAADLSRAIKARDGGEGDKPDADNRFAAVIGTADAPIAATLDHVAFEQLEQDIAAGKPRIETRMLVESATGAAFCARMMAEEKTGDSPRLLAIRPALHPTLRPLTPPPAPQPRGKGDQSAAKGTVIVAIIDEGIGIANDRFRLSPTETRVQYFLDMDIELDKDGNPIPAPLEQDIPLPVDATSGRIWAKAQIDGLLASEPDEPAIYHRMGLIRPGSDLRQPHAFRATHGTHVLDTAAGYDWREDGEAAAKRPIIAVQLPSRIIADRTDSEMHLALEIALDFIRTKAAALSAEINGGVPLPLVVNFSFGNYAGPQDGTSAIESRIRDFLTTYRGQAERPGGESGGSQCELVLAGGNSFQAQVHARVPVAGPEPQRLTWVVEPEDGTASYAHIWLPPTEKPGQRIAIALTPPRDAPPVKMFSTLGSVLEWRTERGVLARIYHRRDPASGREAITLCLRATFDRDPQAPVCPPGDWTIELLGTDPADTVEAACRIHRDDALAYGRREGRQSYFTDDAYRATDPVTGAPLNTSDAQGSTIRRDGTLSVYGGGTMPVVVGGYVALDGEPALYSSAGPTDNPERSGPDLSAVSDEGYALQGIVASGTYSGSWVRLNGTSVAAPQVTRALADSIGSGGPGYAALTTPSTPPPSPTRLGASRLG